MEFTSFLKQKISHLNDRSFVWFQACQTLTVGVLAVRGLVRGCPTLVGPCLSLLCLSGGIGREESSRVGLRMDADAGKEDDEWKSGGEHRRGS